jgi:hypothetical protein
LQNGCQKLRINLVGHVCVFVGCVCCTPTGNHTGQPPANFAQAPSGAGCARLATLAFAPPPLEGALRSRRTQLQNKLYTGVFRGLWFVQIWEDDRRARGQIWEERECCFSCK